MFEKSRSALATAFAVLAVAAPSAAAMYEPMDVRGEHAAGATVQQQSSTPGGGDLRSPDAVVPFERPVVVEVDGSPAVSGFDWSDAVIGLGIGIALVLLAGAAVATGRRRHTRPTAA